MICLNIASLTALCHLPVQSISGEAGKKKVAGVIGDVLVCDKNQNLKSDYLLLVNHPSTCANVLKVGDGYCAN